MATDIEAALRKDSSIQWPPSNTIKVGDCFKSITDFIRTVNKPSSQTQRYGLFYLKDIDHKNRIVFRCKQCFNVILLHENYKQVGKVEFQVVRIDDQHDHRKAVWFRSTKFQNQIYKDIDDKKKCIENILIQTKTLSYFNKISISKFPAFLINEKKEINIYCGQYLRCKQYPGRSCIIYRFQFENNILTQKQQIKKLITNSEQLIWLCVAEALIDAIMNGIINIKFFVPQTIIHGIKKLPKQIRNQQKLIIKLLKQFYLIYMAEQGKNILNQNHSSVTFQKINQFVEEQLKQEARQLLIQSGKKAKIIYHLNQ